MQAGWWLPERFGVIGMKLIQALSQLMNPIHLVCSNQCILPILFAKRTLNAHTSDSSVTPRYRWIPCSFLAHDKSVAPSPSCTESQRQGHTCDRAQRQSVRDTRCQTDTGKDTKWNTQIWFTCGQPALTQMAAPELLLSLLLSWWELRPRQSAPATQRELGKGKAVVTLLLVRHTTHYWCPKAFMVASVSPPSGPETPQLFLYWIDITWYLHLEDSTDTNSGRSCISSKLLHKFLGFLDTTFSFELATFFFFLRSIPYLIVREGICDQAAGNRCLMMVEEHWKLSCTEDVSELRMENTDSSSISLDRRRMMDIAWNCTVQRYVYKWRRKVAVPFCVQFVKGKILQAEPEQWSARTV